MACSVFIQYSAHPLNVTSPTSIIQEAYYLKYRLLGFYFHTPCLKMFFECIWQGEGKTRRYQLVLSISLKQHCISFLSCFCPQLPSTLFHLQASQSPLSISHASHEYLCVPVENTSWNHRHRKADSPSHVITAGTDGFISRHVNCAASRDVIGLI